MDIGALIQGLSQSGAYGHDASELEIHQTHISVVALAGPFAYKVKKPVDLHFLDFTTLDRRRFFCEEEVRLNRRLAPHTYLGVVPLTRAGGAIQVDGSGRPIEYAVKMERLPVEANLESRLRSGESLGTTLEALGQRVAEFHAQAGRGPDVSAFGRWSVVAANARDNLVRSRDQVGLSLSSEVFDRLGRALEDRLAEDRPLIESRARAGVPRDTHGDLHLDHVYTFPERAPPNDMVIIDCIEFGEQFRYADPVADMAFLAMDLAWHGRRDLERRFVDAYFATSGDDDGRSLLRLYESYRAAVRAKVEGILLREPEVTDEARREALQRATGHWLLALSELESPSHRPGLVLLGGLPGSGKSTIAARLAAHGGFTTVSADRTRKELAGLRPNDSAAAGFEQGIYSSEWTARTYQACLSQARELLLRGQRVLVDATFRQESRRKVFFEVATELGVRSLFVACQSRPETIRSRLEERRGDASDADWAIYQALADRWEEPPPATQRLSVEIDTNGPSDDSVTAALKALKIHALWAFQP